MSSEEEESALCFAFASRGAQLVAAGEEQVKERDDRALELRAAAGVDGRRAEGLPDDALADVGGDEERDARAQPIPFLQQLVEDDHDDA